jgi:hypothetical protein
MHAHGDPLPVHQRDEWKQLRGVLLRASLLGPSDAAERRGAEPASNEAALSRSSTYSLLTEDPTSPDRSNRLLCDSTTSENPIE